MGPRCVATPIMVITLLLLAPLPGAAQSDESSAPPRTPWGAPDLQGVWDFRSMTPLERPPELAGKKVLTDEEAAAFEQQRLEALDKDRRDEEGKIPLSGGYNDFWWDYGRELGEDKRTSLIVDPPDGTIPRLTPAAQQRRDARRVARLRPAHSPVDRGVAERCILGFNSGPPMNPSAYNNNVQLFQTPEYVAILNEMVHNPRLVTLDGRPHLPEQIRQWVGSSRGRWDGDTLVVETTNFTDKTSFRGSGKHLHLVERFTRVDADTLLYEYTIDDPVSFERPWTAAVRMENNEWPIFEYACHEGNYGMFNLLAGARAEDRAAAATEADESK